MSDTDCLIENSGLRLEIEEAVQEGDHREVARLYGHLKDKHPENYNFIEQEIVALQRCYEWAKADCQSKAATTCFPNSLRLALIHSRNPYQNYDWQVAIDRIPDALARKTKISLNQII